MKISGKTKNLKHDTVEIGFPGKPKKHLLLKNFANIKGLPGLIATPLKTLFNLKTETARRANGKEWSKGIGRVLEGCKALNNLRKEWTD